MRIGVCTGGGDAPGLNAAIRGVVLAAAQRGWETHGICRGFDGLLGEADVRLLRPGDVQAITHLGGTILGTTNRGNPFAWSRKRPDGTWGNVDRSHEVVAAVRERKLDALVVIGGDGTLKIAGELAAKGVSLVGIPKTIDNDVGCTSSSLGYDTALGFATEAVDRIRATAESHERVMVMEVMGRHAGWIALHAGLAGGADAILIPEIPYDLGKVCARITTGEGRSQRFAIVVVAEGAAPPGGLATVKAAARAGANERLGGVGEVVAREISDRTGMEARAVTLGHLQRGGSPTWFDRLLALRFGVAAVRAVAAREFSTVATYSAPDVVLRPLRDVLAKSPRLVQPDGDGVRAARELGIALGD